MTDIDWRLIELAERIYPDATDPVARAICEAIFRLGDTGGAAGIESAADRQAKSFVGDTLRTLDSMLSGLTG